MRSDPGPPRVPSNQSRAVGSTSPAQSGPATGLSDEFAMDPVVAALPDYGGAVAPARRAPPRAGRHGTAPARSCARLLVVAVLIVGGIALYVWWYWRDMRAVADLRTIEIWIGNREYGLAGRSCGST